VKRLLSKVTDRLDHQYLNEVEPFKELNPSAENLARYLFRETNLLVSSTTQGRACVKRVKVWETEQNAVTYIE
jgi:6-pyruvoyltetrahydropterin/6-carboxytetrahydropterin synthase